VFFHYTRNKNKERLLEERQKKYKKNKKKYQRNQKKYIKRYKKKWIIFGDYLLGLIGAHREYCGESEIREGVEGVAKKLGIKPSLLSRIIKGNRRPTEELLETISEKYEVPIETSREKLKLEKGQKNMIKIANVTL
jgi:transcriptional regulator with XRE-family HTH domain